MYSRENKYKGDLAVLNLPARRCDDLATNDGLNRRSSRRQDLSISSGFKGQPSSATAAARAEVASGARLRMSGMWAAAGGAVEGGGSARLAAAPSRVATSPHCAASRRYTARLRRSAAACLRGDSPTPLPARLGGYGHAQRHSTVAGFSFSMECTQRKCLKCFASKIHWWTRHTSHYFHGTPRIH